MTYRSYSLRDTLAIGRIMSLVAILTNYYIACPRVRICINRYNVTIF
jgi:hypothetical protein